MGERRIDIIFEATTVSNNYNDGQSDIHSAVSYAWRNFTGGYVNSDRCDPPWYVGKSRGFTSNGGTPVDRVFTTVAFLDKRSAADILLKMVGEEVFLALLLENTGLPDVIKDYNITNFRLETA